MNKAQALQEFWGSFGLPAYDENTVPDDAQMPYITYEVATDSLGNVVPVAASLWYRSNSWTAISLKALEIEGRLRDMNPPALKFDGGRLYLFRGTPFAQRMEDPEDGAVRRIYINANAEFLSA